MIKILDEDKLGFAYETSPGVWTYNRAVEDCTAKLVQTSDPKEKEYLKKRLAQLISKDAHGYLSYLKEKHQW